MTEDERLKEKIKTHYEKHKTAYLIVGLGFMIIATALITRHIVRRNDIKLTSLSGRDVVQLALADESQINIASQVFNIKENSVSPLSYIISCDQTGEWFKSQAEACRMFGISPSRMSDHINHGSMLPGDLSFTRQGTSGF